MTTAVQQLPAHLEKRYGIRVEKLTPLEPWAPEGVQRVDRRDGPAWVARVFPKARPVEAVEGDREILRFLEEHDYPAERCAHSEPASTFGTPSVLVTEGLPGVNARGKDGGQTVHMVVDLLGRLHTLPAGTGAVAREAGGWHHLSVGGDSRREDVAVLKPLMDKAAERLPAGERGDYELLVKELESIDHCDDLPHALINVDFGGPKIILSDGGEATVVDWTGAGRGPWVLSMCALLNRDLRLVDAFTAGYRKHVPLEPQELDRLAGAIAHASPADFLRIIVRDLDWTAAMADGRVRIDGDPAEVETLFAGRR